MKYIIKYSYRNGPEEDIDEADDEEEAIHLLREYRVAYGEGCRVWSVPEVNA